jgi:aminopeptidase N
LVVWQQSQKAEMIRYSFFLIILIISISCSKPPIQIPDKGVSIELNDKRKRSISNINYLLSLEIPIKKSEKIPGNISITFSLSTLSDPVILDFSVDSTHVTRITVKDNEIPYLFINEHIIIDPKYFSKGENSLKVEFVAGDLSLNRNDDYLYTLFVPDRASTCFPLFDQPNLKATYQLLLSTPLDWEAVSNGELVELKKDRERAHYLFKKTKPISSYLVAFAVGKFNKASRKILDRDMTMYYRETDSVKVNKNLDEIFQLHGKALTWLENYTGIQFPFDKFDFVLIPSFQYGGMEHPGSIFYNESSIFLDDNASVNRKMGRASLIAHETAHMWFGDLVTMDWFNDVWMKEVFANFMAAKIVQPSFPEVDHNLRFLLAHYPSAYKVDRSLGANPILQPLDNLKQAGTLYGAIIYQKAPIVMRHLERKLGEDVMRESLSEYLKTYAFSNARWDDLISIMDRRSPEDLKAWSDIWVKTPGMPSYEWSSDWKLSQVKDTISNRVWQQPIMISRAGKKDTTIYIRSVQPVVVNGSENNFLNPDGFSYGYFKMDESTKNIFLQNPTSNINPVFRASMWLNVWESMLRGDGPQPDQFVTIVLNAINQEQDPLIIDFLLSSLQTSWWTYLPDYNRSLLQSDAENDLWNLVEKTEDAGKKNSYFRTYRSIVLSGEGLTKLESIWNDKLVVKDLLLSEEDKISISYELALKIPEREEEFLSRQLDVTNNPDRKVRMRFVMPALSNDQKKRDDFFESLRREVNREHEPWVLEALHYLHHPLRTSSSIRYLHTSLDLLQEVQLTGDIFFPQRWLETTFDGYSSEEAIKVVNDFLFNNPNYPGYLKNKILQATDGLKRAVVLQHDMNQAARNQ